MKRHLNPKHILSKEVAIEKLRPFIAIGFKKRQLEELDGLLIHSVGAARSYTNCLKILLEWRQESFGIDPREMILPDEFELFLNAISLLVQQKTLDQYRHSFQQCLGIQMANIKSDLVPIVRSRAILHAELAAVVRKLSPEHALSTMVVANAGLRASEINELWPADALSPSDYYRDLEGMFAGRHDVVIATVKGKGGLRRPVAIDYRLYEELMKYKLSEPKQICDRGVFRRTYFDLPGGQKLSQAYSEASIKATGQSKGIHGLRHSYVQARVPAMMKQQKAYRDALKITSEEVGHHRTEITYGYFA